MSDSSTQGAKTPRTNLPAHQRYELITWIKENAEAIGKMTLRKHVVTEAQKFFAGRFIVTDSATEGALKIAGITLTNARPPKPKPPANPNQVIARAVVQICKALQINPDDDLLAICDFPKDLLG